MKIQNIRNFVTTKNPDPLDIQRAHAKAMKQGYLFGPDGRCYAPFLRATPRFPDGTKGRWEKGQIVTRKTA